MRNRVIAAGFAGRVGCRLARDGSRGLERESDRISIGRTQVTAIVRETKRSGGSKLPCRKRWHATALQVRRSFSGQAPERLFRGTGSLSAHLFGETAGAA